MTTQELFHKINIELSKIHTDRGTHQEIVRILSEIQKEVEKEK